MAVMVTMVVAARDVEMSTTDAKMDVNMGLVVAVVTAVDDRGGNRDGLRRVVDGRGRNVVHRGRRRSHNDLYNRLQ